MNEQIKADEIEHSDEIFYPSFLFKEIYSETRPTPPTTFLFPSPNGISCPCMNY